MPLFKLSNYSKLVATAFLPTAVALAGCNSSYPAGSLLKDEAPPYQSQKFFEKASMLLRSGKLPTATETARWRGESRAEAVEEMMADPAFGTTVLDFGLYFLGARPLNVRQWNDRWQGIAFAPSAYAHPSAIHAARETLLGGNFFTLLEADQPLYIAPIARYADESSGHDQLISLFSAAAALFAPGPGSVADACTALAALGLDDQIQAVMRDARFQETLTDGLRLAFRQTVLKKCYEDAADPAQTRPMILSRINAMERRIDAVYAYEATQSVATYPQSVVTDIRDAIDVLPEAAVKGALFTREGFWRTYVNSSTNFDRKRARYVLDRFFCDDLTPLDLPNPEPHGEGRHASDPSCQSCHYRLDPMGGFFREIGAMGRNREGAGYLDFDDMASLEGDARQSYLDFWKEPVPNAGRPWRVGYIRDPSDASRNTYGSTFGDLMGILKTAPEVRQCLVRRLAAYVLGPAQAVDGRWLQAAGAPLTIASEATSAAAFKSTIARLVLSQTFATDDADPTACLDLLDGTAAPAAPCAIAWILDKNCKSCHAGPGARGGLDLTAWIPGPDGRAVFTHIVEESGGTRQLTRGESFDRIKARLSTTDANEIMPPRFMDPTERSHLLNFIAGDAP